MGECGWLGVCETKQEERPQHKKTTLSRPQNKSIFSYTTPTRVKLILVAADPQPRDDALRGAFASLHAAFVDAASNPFYSPGDALPAGSAFGGAVRRAIEGL